MNELQAIVEAMNSLGEDAKVAFIVWVAVKYGAGVIGSIMWLIGWGGLFVTIYGTTHYCVSQFYKHNCNP